MMYERPDLIFDATSCGGNCAKWILEIGRLKDITINLKYMMRFNKSENLDIFIINEQRVIKEYKDYVMTAVKYV